MWRNITIQPLLAKGHNLIDPVTFRSGHVCIRLVWYELEWYESYLSQHKKLDYDKAVSLKWIISFYENDTAIDNLWDRYPLLAHCPHLRLFSSKDSSKFWTKSEKSQRIEMLWDQSRAHSVSQGETQGICQKDNKSFFGKHLFRLRSEAAEHEALIRLNSRTAERSSKDVCTFNRK